MKVSDFNVQPMDAIPSGHTALRVTPEMLVAQEVVAKFVAHEAPVWQLEPYNGKYAEAKQLDGVVTRLRNVSKDQNIVVSKRGKYIYLVKKA